MNKRKPSILSQLIDGDSATLTLGVDSDIYDFSGHFAQFPLLPGVTQIDWVMHYAKQILKISAPFSGMEVIKFQQPILPGAQVQLTLNWDSNRHKLAFQYAAVDGAIHSSGKIKLAHSS
jgi:3-hydroxymyristoyl/3-hydroxydecanoyl-(acyl carrier protein) dehydratase